MGGSSGKELSSPAWVPTKLRAGDLRNQRARGFFVSRVPEDPHNNEAENLSVSWEGRWNLGSGAKG